jgi:hypothetical protein
MMIDDVAENFPFRLSQASFFHDGAFPEDSDGNDYTYSLPLGYPSADPWSRISSKFSEFQENRLPRGAGEAIGRRKKWMANYIQGMHGVGYGLSLKLNETL